ncbi:MAG: DUF3309 domain-containing protein [Anaerolineales bacterium]
MLELILVILLLLALFGAFRGGRWRVPGGALGLLLLILLILALTNTI